MWCNMNIQSICFYVSIFYLSYLEYIGDPGVNRQFAITIIFGLIAILNNLNKK